MMIHLESLNYQLFMSFPEIFKEIHKIKNEGVFYNHYFSTATSTLMVLGDIFYGAKEQYEVCTSMDYIPKDYFYKDSLFDELKNSGYKTGIFVYPDGGDRESAEGRHIAGFQNKMVLISEYEELLQTVEDLISEEPFAIMVCNYISNIKFNSYIDTKNILDGTDKWKFGYQYLDKCVGDLINLLKRKQKLDDTYIVLYGDHGDDFWGHGMHQGLTHAIEPFTNLIHTPMIIFDTTQEKKFEDQLICAADLRQIISDRLKLRQCSKNIKNEYIIARSAYAAQPIRKESFNKSYSITDGKFILLVSNNGLEMYDVEMDFQCGYNLLEQFSTDGILIRYNMIKKEKLSYHYFHFMEEQEEEIIRLRQTAYYLRKRLYDETLKLYEAAGRIEKDMLEEMSFYKIHYKYQ